MSINTDIRLLERASDLIGVEVNRIVSELPAKGWDIHISYRDGEYIVTLTHKDGRTFGGRSDNSSQGALARAAIRMAEG